MGLTPFVLSCGSARCYTLRMNRRAFLTTVACGPFLFPSRLRADKEKPRELRADVVIIGGSTGGVAAALAAARGGAHVVLTEETDWIGGQLTSQAVPPDEHLWVENFGVTRSYRRF